MLTNILDYLRFALYAILVVIMMLLYQLWEKEHPKLPTPAPTANVQTVNNAYIPEVTSKSTETAATSVTNPSPVVTSGQIVHVKTDVLDVDIDTNGGNIVQVRLPTYPESLHSKTPYILLTNAPDNRYIAQSGLLSTNGPDMTKGQAIYTSDQTEYTLDKNQNELQVNLHWQNEQGVKVTKTFTFKPNDYEIGLNYKVDNQSKQPWEGNLYLQLLRKNTPPASGSGVTSFATYFGAAISSPDKPFEKISFKNMAQQPLDRTITGGWAAMIQHYFVSAWVPDKNVTSQYFSRITNDGLYTIGMIGPKITVMPGASINTSAKFYSGPSIADRLEKVAPGLPLTIDYGWFWFISGIIFWMMQKNL